MIGPKIMLIRITKNTTMTREHLLFTHNFK